MFGNFFSFSVSRQFNISTISSFEPPSSTPGEIDRCPHGRFCPKYDTKKLLFEAFFIIMRIFGSVQPESECIFPFQYKIVFQPYPSFKPPSSTPGEDIARELFCQKFDAEKLLFEAFLIIMSIFYSIPPTSECIFPLLSNLKFKPYHLSSPLAPLWGGIDLCACGLFCPKFDAEKLLFEAFFLG